ncbi:unnamed protein product [Mucor hiemalis]
MSVDSSFDDSSSEGQFVEVQVQDQLTEFNDEYDRSFFGSLRILVHKESGVTVCTTCKQAVNIKTIRRHFTEKHQFLQRDCLKDLQEKLILVGAKSNGDLEMYQNPPKLQLPVLSALPVIDGFYCGFCIGEHFFVNSSRDKLCSHITETHVDDVESSDSGILKCSVQTTSSQKRKNFYLVSSRCTTKVDVPEEGQRLKDALLLNHKVVSNPYEQSGVYSHRDKLANEFVNHFGIHHFVNKFLDANNQGLKGRMVLRTFVMKETEGRSMIFANVRAAVSSYFLKIQEYLKDGSSNYYWRREVMKYGKEKDAPTSDLRCLEPETVKRYSGIWADMVMMVLRTMCDESEEEHKSVYLSFSGLNFVNPEQAELAEKLIAEAAIFPRDDVMQELVHDLSLSMILVEKNSGQPEETLNVMDTFTMLSCIGPNGEWRPVQQATQISAALLYNSRASVLHEIMQQEQQKRPEE